jgi:hypothetical protein
MISEPREGQFVRYRPEIAPDTAQQSEPGRPVLITRVGDSAATVDVPRITARSTDGEFGAAPAELHPLGDVSDADLAALQEIVVAHTEWLSTQFRNEFDSAQDHLAHAQRAEEKIADMRRYAIQAHQDHDICRAGLDDFLETFDLAPYRPQFSALVDLRVRVGGYADITDATEVECIVRRILDIASTDEEITVDGWDVDRVDEDELELNPAA